MTNRAKFYENEFIKLKGYTDHLLQNPLVTNIPKEEITPILNIIQEPLDMNKINSPIMVPAHLNPNPNIPQTPTFPMGPPPPPPKLTRIIRMVPANTISRGIQLSPMKPIPISPTNPKYIQEIPNTQILNQPSVIIPHSQVIINRQVSPINQNFESAPIYSMPEIQNIERIGKFQEGSPPQNFQVPNPYEKRGKTFTVIPQHPETVQNDYQYRNNPNNIAFSAKY